MEDWYPIGPKRSQMEIEDAHGGELAKIIQTSHSEANGIIQGMMNHAPLVAQQLQILDMHYHRTLALIEQALRGKQDRPAEQLEQLDILNDFNRSYGSGGSRANVKVDLLDHGTVYGTAYGGGNGHLPTDNYLTKEGPLKVLRWSAELTLDGRPRIIEYLEKGKKKDGYIVITEVADMTAMEEVHLTEFNFAQMLLEEAALYSGEPEAADLPVWVNKRICFKRRPLVDREAWNFFANRYPGLGTPLRTVMRFEFLYNYPFWVGPRPQQYNVFSERMNHALAFDTHDEKYALIFYKTSRDNTLQYLIYEHATGSLKAYRDEWYIAEYLKNTLPSLEAERANLISGQYDLSETHPYTTTSVLPAEIPESIPDRQQISACTRVTFNEVQLVNDGTLARCSHVYVYTVEPKEGQTRLPETKMHFELELVENVDLTNLTREGSRY